MKQPMWNAVVCNAAPDLGGAATRADAVTPEEAEKAEDARYAAQTGGDFAAMERLYADDLVYVHAGGDIDDKASFIEIQRSRTVVYHRMRRSDVKVRVYGPVAIITGKGEFDVTVKGEDRTANVLFHSIWIRRGADLQFVSWHAVPAPK